MPKIIKIEKSLYLHIYNQTNEIRENNEEEGIFNLIFRSRKQKLFILRALQFFPLRQRIFTID